MTPELRITVLMENTAREGLEAEHGLSFFLEAGAFCWMRAPPAGLRTMPKSWGWTWMG